VSEASGVDFDEVSQENLTPQQMQEALVQIQTDIAPKRIPKASKKYSVDEKTGEKKRVFDKEKTDRN
jgi:hypothetical protein